MAAELDTIQARARFSQITGGIEPLVAPDGAFELRGARHPLLMSAVRAREDVEDEAPATRTHAEPVAVDVLMTPPTRVLIIAGPNTGGKTVALKTAGLFAAMAQAGTAPARRQRAPGCPSSRALFADIGDEQSISASLSTFSAHVTNVVSMDRGLALPALVLLDEVGAGTDPAEGGALGTAVIDHFRRRGAHLVATTHFDVLKTYASTTEGVESAAFGFDPADLRAHLSPRLRLAGPQPRHRDRVAAGHAGRRDRGRARQPVGRAKRSSRPTSIASTASCRRSKPSAAPWRRSAARSPRTNASCARARPP